MRAADGKDFGGFREAALAAENSDDYRDEMGGGAGGGEKAGVSDSSTGPVEGGDSEVLAAVEGESFNEGYEIGEERMDVFIIVKDGGENRGNVISDDVGVEEERADGEMSAGRSARREGPRKAAVGVVGAAEKGGAGGVAASWDDSGIVGRGAGEEVGEERR